MVGVNFQSLAKGIIDAFQPIVEVFMQTMGFPLNGAIAMIWGGIKELLFNVLFR